MDLHTFEAEAKRRGNYYDNGPAAMAYWAKCWGLGYHSRLWAYKEYRLGDMLYRTGKVRLRHGSYTSTDYMIGGEHVARYRFFKTLETFAAPPLTADEQKHIDDETARQEAQDKAERIARMCRPRRRRKVAQEGPTLFDMAV